MSLQKAVFIRLDENLQTLSGDQNRAEVRFNPTEFSLTKNAQYAEIGIPGLDSPLQQFVRGQTETLSLDLFFDTTEHGMGEQATVRPVTELTDKFYQLVKIHPNTKAPPILLFKWGSVGFPGSRMSSPWAENRREGFICVMESITQKFTLFSPLGVPLRATLTLKLREYQTLAQQVNAIQQTYIVQAGDSLSDIANQTLGEADKWRDIATANNITDPTNIEPGTILQIPLG